MERVLQSRRSPADSRRLAPEPTPSLRGTHVCFCAWVTYSALFIGFLLIYLPARVLSWSGIVRPTAIAGPQVAGMLIGSRWRGGRAWCIFTFATIGRGTPAPFDPPRRLVVRGPYRFVAILCTSARDSPSLAPRCSTSRFPFWAIRGFSFSQRTSSWCCTRSPLYGEPSGRVRSVLPPSRALVAEGVRFPHAR